MNVLFVTAECYPFMKTGGLGDVSYSLPKKLKDDGVDVRVIMPKYKFEKKIRRRMKKICSFSTYIGWITIECSLWTIRRDNVTFYFIDNPRYYYRQKPYGYYDDCERFVFFSKAVLEAIKYIPGFTPDIIHCNDWHSALVIPLKDIYYKDDTIYQSMKTVFTIHNILYQGIFSPDILWMLGIDSEKYFTDKCLKYYDSVSFMKWAILTADVVSTVSMTYAEELSDEYISFGLSQIFKQRNDKVVGILNGVDWDVFNPAKDKELYKNFKKESLYLKDDNKESLQRELDMEVDRSIPLISVVSRLTEQKGLDLLEASIHEIMSKNVQLIINGVGDKSFECMLKYMEVKYKGRFKACLKFDPSMAKRVYASSDMFLMPSRFEPCGLGQMIAMRYGTVPIVRNTGGLKDTIKEFNKYTMEGQGFTFDDYSIEGLLSAIDAALRIYKNKDIWNKLRASDMEVDLSWERSSKDYIKMYEKVMKKKRYIDKSNK